MAIAITTTQSKQQFQGLFNEIWAVSCTGCDFGNAATGSGTFASLDVTVPGVAIGDLFMGIAMGVDTVDGVIGGAVTAANTVTITLLNNSAGAIDLAATTCKFLVGRPNW
jgi:hypothetical protein